jgi:rhodanese-related sulfurtransferase
VARTTVDDLLARARERLERLTPGEARAAVREGALLVDIRSEVQRAVDGVVPQAVFVPRNVLEWRLDPDSGAPNPALARPEAQVIVMCDAGYQSSLAAATLQDLGFDRATDVIGGFQAWRGSGLPVASQ